MKQFADHQERKAYLRLMHLPANELANTVLVVKLEFDRLYNDYLDEATLLSLAGFVAIVALLAVTLRSARRLGAVLLPLLWRVNSCTSCT